MLVEAVLENSQGRKNIVLSILFLEKNGSGWCSKEQRGSLWVEFMYWLDNASAHKLAEQVLGIAGRASKTCADLVRDFVAALSKAINMCRLSFWKIGMPAASSFLPENMID